MPIILWELIGVVAIMVIGYVTMLLLGSPLWFLGRLLKRTQDEDTTQHIIVSAPAAPALIRPGEYAPGSRAPVEENHKPKEDARKHLEGMVALLTQRTYELLMEEGLDKREAKVLSEAYGTVERLAQVPYVCEDGKHSEYIPELMPVDGPLQTAAYEMARAVRKGKDAMMLAGSVRDADVIESGWHLDVVTC